MDTLESRLETPPTSGSGGPDRRVFRRRRLIAIAVVLALIVGGVFILGRGDEPADVPPEDVRGSPAWAQKYYGDPDARGFKRRNVIEIEFLGRAMFVHKDAARHFLRLESLFEARAPEYAAAVALGELDDWSYINRNVRGAEVKSNHAFGLAIDVNALENPLGTSGNIPPEVVAQWEAEVGDWGGDWNRPDPMHFETHLTPEEIRNRYHADGTPRDWYLNQLTSGD